MDKLVYFLLSFSNKPCLTISNKTIPAATEALRDSNSDDNGIDITSSHFDIREKDSSLMSLKVCWDNSMIELRKAFVPMP